ncbi:hypothetical protein BDV93DRAFT_515694 [Ceratobasidium sp. AG-I]|nr:hypothetical protein BDV93DRAFT_515694 [Ceratobasidium sp. AG-I]
MGGDAGTQFEPHSDNEDTFYNVEKILDEAGRRYLVQWEGRDPATGKKWPPDWSKPVMVSFDKRSGISDTIICFRLNMLLNVLDDRPFYTELHHHSAVATLHTN